MMRKKCCYKNGEIEVIRIFLENGMPIEHYEVMNYYRKYPNNRITEYLKNIPLVKRKLVLLDPCLFGKIPEPNLIKVGFFGGKFAKEKNTRIMANYEDRIEAQKRYINQIGRDIWQKEKDDDEMLSQALIDIACKKQI